MVMTEEAEKILEMVRALPGEIGLVIRDTVTGEEISWGKDTPVVAASVIKILVMAEAFRQKEEGILDFEKEITVRKEDKLPSCGALTYLHDGISVQIGDLVTLMIILSDNTATNLLIDLLGQDHIQTMCSTLGLSHTFLRRKLFMSELSRKGIENSISAGDMAHVMALLMEGKVVSRCASENMLEILSNQRLNGKMPFYLHSRGIRCAHKTGEDDGITHDVGIIYAAHPVIFCFVSQYTDVPAAERVIQEAARLCLNGRELEEAK